MKFVALVAVLIAAFSVIPSFAQEIPQTRDDMQMSFAPVVKQVAPAVINIYTKRMVTRNVSPFMNDPFFAQFFGRGIGIPQQRLERSLGSGVILNERGLAITNAHVIRDAQEITVALTDGREFPAILLLQDDAMDLALIQIDAHAIALPFAALKPSESLEVGDLVLAIGNPFGVGQTVTSGIVSALARSSLNISDFNFFIQTDAAINPGNSGGPLVAMDGKVVGINSAIYSKDGGSLGIGFAIPSEMVATVLAAQKSGQVSKNGAIIRPWTGITAQDVTPDIALSMGLATPKGALISNLHEASPALSAGLEQGDVVTGVQEHKVGDAAEMRFRLATLPLGASADVTYMRGGKESHTTITAVAPPDIPARATVTIAGKTPLSGATLMNINPAVEAELGLKNAPTKGGVVVATITPNSIAARVVGVGDIIVAVNGTKIGQPADAQKALAKPTPQGWTLTLVSHGQERTIAIR